MALENKKSLLQPESVEAQQYRLQNSRLAARVEQTISTGNQQSSAGAARLAGRPSVLAPSTPPSPLPAESNATATSTLPGGSATPIATTTTSETVSSTSPSVPTSEVIYSDRAADFDGSFFFTASNADLGFSTPSGSYAVAVMFKPDRFIAGHTQTIFHTYTGSFASHSLELSLAQGGDLHLKYSHNGGYIRYRVQEKHYRNSVGKSANGYTFVEFQKAATPQYLINQGTILKESSHMVNFNGAGYMGTKNKSLNAHLVNTASFDISNNDNFYIGGTAATPNANFSGSIAFIRFGDSLLTSDHLKLRDGEKDVVATVDFQGVGRPASRAYKFSTTGAVEHTGSLATVQVPLGLSGSYAHVASYK